MSTTSSRPPRLCRASPATWLIRKSQLAESNPCMMALFKLIALIVSLIRITKLKLLGVSTRNEITDLITVQTPTLKQLKKRKPTDKNIMQLHWIVDYQTWLRKTSWSNTNLKFHRLMFMTNHTKSGCLCLKLISIWICRCERQKPPSYAKTKAPRSARIRRHTGRPASRNSGKRVPIPNLFRTI